MIFKGCSRLKDGQGIFKKFSKFLKQDLALEVRLRSTKS